MNLYLDDDSIAQVLVTGLSRAGHDVQLPADVGLRGNDDAVHLLHAIRVDRVLLSHNHDDFENLHELVIGSGGSHPGVFIVRRDGDQRDMRAHVIVRAIEKVAAAGTPVKNLLTILNHWR